MSQKSLGEQNYEHFAHRFAKYSEKKVHTAHYERPNTLALLPDVRGQRVLDAGCGPGFYAEELLKRGAGLLAVDVTPDFVDITKKRVAGRATVLLADLEQPFDFAADDEFDGVLCTLVLDYLEDWGRIFAEFYRLLKPGGWLLFSAGHPLADWQWLKRVYPEQATSYFDTQLFTAKWGGFGDPPVPITSYRRPLAAMFNPLLTAGFQLERVHEAQPTEAARESDPEDYEHLNTEPGFITILARKPQPLKT